MHTDTYLLIVEQIDFTSTETLTPTNVASAQFSLWNEGKSNAKFPIQYGNIESFKYIRNFETNRQHENVSEIEACAYVNEFNIKYKHINPYTRFGYVVIPIPKHLNDLFYKASIFGWKDLK